ncbi:unnamed protein product [Calypogeia fissa]
MAAVTLSDKAPIFISKWPMTIFGSPKYKCKVAAGAKCRGYFDTKNSHIREHKSKLWNWQRPFFRCSCYYKPSCLGQLVWLDHAVWYMLNHLDTFFTASSIQGHLVMLIKFLSGDARRMVLDHIAFLYLREFTIEAAHELMDHPDDHFLTQYGSAKGTRMVEALVKPGMFSENSDLFKEDNSKRKWNLNVAPAAPPRRKGMYANQTVTIGLGRGGPSSSNPVPMARDRATDGSSRNRLGHGKTMPGHISPIQKRNFNF